MLVFRCGLLKRKFIMTMKKSYLAMAMFGAMLENSLFAQEEKPRRFEPLSEPKKIIPKGCKEYYFDKNGNFPNQWGINNGESIFYCIASSKKNAIVKFQKFLKKRE
jgi:hypothetical protein